MFPPRQKHKIIQIKSEQNLQCINGKQFGIYLPDKSQKILKNTIVNICRPISSKLSTKTGISSQSNCNTRPISAYRTININTNININKSQNNSLQKRCQNQHTLNLKLKQRCSNQNIVKFRYQNQNQLIKTTLPKITSKYWGVYQLKQQKIIYGLHTKKRIQVASLTKIMNLYTIVQLILTYDINPKLIKISMSQLATNMIGTSAQLQKRDIITLQDLLYGMMLPSGNDAACQISMIGGTILKLAQLDKINKIYQRDYIQNILQCRSNIVRYLSLMNKLSNKLQMNKTKWTNTHGLSNKQNKTTIQDMFILCKQAMSIPYIRKIVNTKRYICQIQSYFGVQWQNTNKMLWKGWNGIKTGVTPNAGPCLAALYYDQCMNRQYLVVIADCVSMNQRWDEVERIVNWVRQNQLN